MRMLEDRRRGLRFAAGGQPQQPAQVDIAEYERLRRSAEEAARAERHPGIAFRGTEGSRRAWVPGTALDVWEIVAGYEEMGR